MGKHLLDEHREKIWILLESGGGTVEELAKKMGEKYNPASLEQLVAAGDILVDEKTHEINFTPKGLEAGRLLIRSHRIAERLISDVLGGEFEVGACEFEHLTNKDLVDSLCTLLGHPRECPHGHPIPLGECCRISADTVKSSILPLSSLEIGQCAEIAYVQCKDKREIHLLEGLQLKPGTTVKLHQRFPTYVIEVEGAQIAVDDEVVKNIKIWVSSTRSSCPETEKETSEDLEQKRHGRHRGFHFGKRGIH